MRRSLSVLVLCVAILAVSGCYQKYYCKLFRVESARTDRIGSFSKELLDGKFGSLANSDMFIRVVAVWDSNNKDLMANTFYSFSVQQRAKGVLIDTLRVDSLVVSFRPLGEQYVLGKRSMAVMEGDYVPEPRVKTTFRDLTIPNSVDSILVSLTVRESSSKREIDREFSIAMTRYEGTVEKFGYRPKD